MLAAVGHKVITLVLFLSDLTEIILHAVRNSLASVHHGGRPVFRVYLKQVYFTGLEALRIIVIISFIIGIVIIAQMVGITGVGSGSLIGKALVWVVVKELGPLLTAIIVIARSGTAIAAELGHMKISGEIESIESLGIPYEHYLIMPRVLGVTTAVIVLTVYFETVSIAGGFLVASAGWHIPFEQYAQGIISALTLRELAASFLKSLLFGLFITAACCRKGLGVGKSVTHIPQAATKAVMQSLFLIFILDGIITFIFLLN